MKRTRVPATIEKNEKRYTLEEITDNLTKSDRAKLLADHTSVQLRLFNIKRDIYEIGKLLYEDKKLLSHGMFTPWIALTFGNELPYPTANFYMKVYETFKDNPNTVQYIPTKYLLMVTSNKFPAEIVKLLNEHSEKISKEALQEIHEVYQLFKEGTIGGSQFLRLAEKQIAVGADMWKASANHRINANMRLSLYFGGGDILKRINSLTKIVTEMAAIYPYDPDNHEHKKLIKKIEDTVTGLLVLKEKLEGNGALFKKISTIDGNKWIDSE